ncbi:flagellin [Sporomusa sp.]|uniref:flagellin N-terminal helical domain-containing protein n=1 Tax=Sporomusa sp. TaxID=2078658 RepID=UPI002B9C638A|nr:flagellin [Sporomusa sp.]HWR09712.1 flagellin [Sporomusa sp.]
MIIAHNLAAIYSQNQLKRTEKRSTDVLEKLSSGLRINKAADDAAGLAISEKMRAQIRGLSQAARNVQDAISLVQTAEGGLNNILEPPLQRLRELAIQSGNGTLTTGDRMSIQDEAEQILAEINKIAKNTEFNGMKLLDGTYKNSAVESTQPLTPEWQVDFNGKEIVSMTATSDGGVVVAGRKGSFGAASQNWLAKVDAVGNTIWEKELPLDNSYNVIYNVQALSDGSFIASSRRRNLISSDNQAVIYKISADGEIVNSKILAYGDESLLEIKQTADGGFIAVGVSLQHAFIQKLDSNLQVMATNSFVLPAGSHFKVGIDVVQTSDNGYMLLGEESYATPTGPKGFIMKLDADFSLEWESKIDHTVFSAITMIDDQQAMVLGNTGLYIVDGTGNLSQLSSSIFQVADPYDYEHDWLQKTTDNNYLVGTSDKLVKVASSGEEVWALDIPSLAVTQISDRGYIVANTLHSIVKITPEVLPNSVENKGIQIQTGANTGNTLTLYINNVSTEALGIQGLDLTVTPKLDTALARIDTAIQRVSAERSRLGFYHNALEHIGSNVENSAENLTAAESRIRDVDMAKAMMDLTKFMILKQAGQSMLVQANQQPQSVLQLLN